MRVLFYTFITILGISLSIIILMPSLFDLNNYKGKIEKIVFNKTGNKLSINGDIKLKFRPRLSITINNVNYNIDTNNKLFSSEEFVITPMLYSLLKGNLVFDNIILIIKAILNFPHFVLVNPIP